MHTEFVRERATPGSLVIGADSHTCSSGAVGALAIGLGVADVAIPVITGETWFKVPECINISFVGDLVPGMGGKDVILHLLKRFKRNTIAANRIIEFSGPSLKHLSIDARFAISNMCTVSFVLFAYYEKYLTKTRNLEPSQAYLSLMKSHEDILMEEDVKASNRHLNSISNPIKKRSTQRRSRSTCTTLSHMWPCTRRQTMSYQSWMLSGKK